MNGKWIYLAQRNARLSRDQFVARWLKHRTLGAPPAMGAEFLSADYAAVRAGASDATSTEYDAVGLFTLRALSSIPTVAGFLKLDHIQADEKRFFTTTSDAFSMFAHEKVLLDGPPTGHVLVQFVRRARETSPFDFERLWEAQAPRIHDSTKPVRSIQNVTIAPPPPGFGYDGVGELWFDSVEAMVAAAEVLSQHMASAAEIDARNSFCLITDIVAARPRKTSP